LKASGLLATGIDGGRGWPALAVYAVRLACCWLLLFLGRRLMGLAASYAGDAEFVFEAAYRAVLHRDIAGSRRPMPRGGPAARRLKIA